MHQRARVAIDDDDDDDDDEDENDDGVKQEVTDTIEKFVQSRHVQTLKYLRHVIDENRQLRLHVEHLKRDQDNRVPLPPPLPPPPPPATDIDVAPNPPDIEETVIERVETPVKRDETPVELIETPIREILIQTPEKPTLDIEYVDEGTNTEGDDFEGRYHRLNDELINLKKQHNINREEFQRELDRVDQQNSQLDKEFKSTQQQLSIAQRRNHDKQTEIQTLTSSLADQSATNETLTVRVNKLEQTTERLTQSLTLSEQTRSEYESQVVQLRRIFQEDKQKLFELQIECKNNEQQLQIAEHDLESWKQKLDVEFEKNQQLNEENDVLKENIKYLQIQLHDKILQEQENNRERQLNSNFKDFVQVRRTLQTCQQENEQLKIEMKRLQIKLVNRSD